MLTSISRKGGGAFSMIEMIVVVGIISILVTFAAPHISGILTATKLRNAADEVNSRLLEAQSLAVLFNTEAELRLYEVPDLIDPTRRPTLRKLRLLTLQPPDVDAVAENAGAGVFEVVGAATNLDQGVEINPDAEYSSIIDLGFTEPKDEDEHGRYVAVRYRSDGSAGLQTGKSWFLTLHERDAHVNGKRLKNFITLQIEPATGRIRSFQP